MGELLKAIVSISLFALKESLSRSGLSCSRRPLSLSPWSIGWVGRGGGKRKVLKLLCQIERETDRGGVGEQSRAPAFAPPRPLLSLN